MVEFDWNTPAKDSAEFWSRRDFLADIDIITLLEVDPRDEVFGELLNCHPDPIPVRVQIDGGIGVQAVLAQLIILDMIEAGLVIRVDSAALQITAAGLEFANARFDGPDVNSIYRVRDNAPSFGPLSVSSATALKHLVLHSSPYVKYLLTDVYHPALGRATFD